MPDIMCVGKALTGGYMSLAATLTTPEVCDAIGSGSSPVLMHGPTFMANPLSCAVASASIGLLLEHDWASNTKRIEAGLTKGLAAASEIPAVKDVRVLGAVGVIETEDPIDIGPIQRKLVGMGVWLRPFGKLLYTIPPYIISDDEIALVTSAMTEVASTLAAPSAG
jgi:adenosylmethionine-8-amino-7-oxononanoate aminotransferase